MIHEEGSILALGVPAPAVSPSSVEMGRDGVGLGRQPKLQGTFGFDLQGTAAYPESSPSRPSGHSADATDLMPREQRAREQQPDARNSPVTLVDANIEVVSPALSPRGPRMMARVPAPGLSQPDVSVGTSETETYSKDEGADEDEDEDEGIEGSLGSAGDAYRRTLRDETGAGVTSAARRGRGRSQG